jgi:glycosyltransferase involved in cell wall biosynthesis
MLNGIDVQWILVDDGSKMRPNSTEIERLKTAVENFEFIQLNKNFGKGYAVRMGMHIANAEKFIYTDIDFPYQDQEIQRIYCALQEGADLVIAKRSEQYYTKVSKSRTWISKRFKAVIRMLFNTPTTDTQAGLKGLSLKAHNLLLQTKINRYLFDLELVKSCAKQQLKIVELPVSLKEGVALSDVSYRVLFTELLNLFRIFIQ